MSLTDKLMGMSAEEKADYARQEAEAHEAELSEDDFDGEPIDDDPGLGNRGELDGLIVDTRYWRMLNPSDIEGMNLPHCRRIRADCGTMLSINQYLSASNFRERRGN